MLKEFKAFALKGNMIDMAVGIVVGGAFGKVVSSLVADIMMGPIGTITGGVNFSDKFINLSGEEGIVTLAAAQEAGIPTINYGNFANQIIDFVIIAFTIFIVVKLIESTKRKEEEVRKEVTPPAQEVLLSEIRDLLKNK